MADNANESLRQAALTYHEFPKPGKLEIRATKPLANGRDLARAYSPGVAEACLEIKANPADASRYTSRANQVGVVTNGTAVLGLGNIGALASKPVMEGKAVLFKKFANIDCFDLELDEKDPERLAEIVCALEPSFGAINLEDIKAPDCFIVEKICRERMNIPVFHDDQHGTAIVVGAAATNALHVAGKSFEDIKIVSTELAAGRDRRIMRQAIRAAILAGMALAGTMSAADTDTTYRILEFSDLDGWAADDHSAALSVFLETCGDLDEPDWRNLCAVARETEDAKDFFELFFRPVLISDGNDGLFTGYFEPELDGSLTATPRYRYPIYRMPPEAEEVRPWLDRREILSTDVMQNRGLEIAWVDDPVELFFLQVQGSGRIRLPDGRNLRVGYGGPCWRRPGCLGGSSR